MSTATASTMIVNSLIANGEKIIGGTLTADEQTFYLGKLNAMMESWSLDRLMVYQILQENFALTSALGTYTIGTGAAFSTTRPTKIDSAFIRDSGNIDSDAETLPWDAYDGIVQKNVSGSYPKYIFYDQAFDSSGFGTIKVYPLPQAGLTLFINSWKQLQQFASVSTTLLMPPGYQRAIESNFTIECAPGLKSVQPEIIKIAKESKAAIRGVNLPATISSMDFGISNRSSGSIFEG